MTLSGKQLLGLRSAAATVAPLTTELIEARKTYKGQPDSVESYHVDLLRKVVRGMWKMFEGVADLKISEKVKAARKIEAEVAERRGRPAKKKESIPTRGSEYSPGVETRQIAAGKAGFGSVASYRRAAYVCDRGCQELIAAMDDGTVSIREAERLARLPHAEQRRAL